MKKAGKGKVTLEDISRAINVSRTTIYKILNNKGKVSEETRNKVLAAVREFNYVPNLAAKNLALNRQYRIAFLGHRSPRTPYTLNNLLKGVRWAADEFSDYGLDVSVIITDPDSPDEQEKTLYRLADQGFDGFALFPNRIGPVRDCIRDLISRGMYVVTVNRDVPDSYRHAYSGCDYYSSGMLAAEVLARMIPPGGEIAVLLGGEGEEHLDSVERFAGLKKKMERFPAVTLLPAYTRADNDLQDLQQYLEELIAGRPNLGGILDITYELDLVSRVVHAADNSVRLVGFDLCDTVRHHMIRHSIDAVIFQDMVSQGYQAVKYLYQAISSGTADSFAGVQKPAPSKLEVVYEGNLNFYIQEDGDP